MKPVTVRNKLTQSAPAPCPMVMLIFLLSISALNLNAQQSYPESGIGIRGGMNLNSWTNDFPFYSNGSQTFYPEDWKATIGFHGGVYVNVRLSQLVAIEPGVFYTSRGTGMVGEAAGVSGEVTVVSGYIDLPVLVRLYVLDGFNLFAGPQMAYQVKSTFDAEAEGNVLVDNEEITDELSELDFMLVLGAGYEFSGGFNVNLSGELGFATVDGYDMLNTYNRTIRISLGYTFPRLK